jgi:hypothetical protein
MTTVPPILLKSIKAHIEKGDRAKDKSEQHYISAGRYLAILKQDHTASWAEWEEILRTRLKLSTGRASELMQLADGRKSLQEIRDGKAQSVAQLRARSSSLRSEEKNEEPALEFPRESIAHLPPTAIPAPKSDGAHQLVDSLVTSSSNTREAAANLLISGPRQSQFQSAVIAVSDLYQALARAGR